MLRLVYNSLINIILSLRHSAYDFGIFKSQSVKTKVISIGSLTIGGAGKTPLTVKVAQMLISQGKNIAILSRGYGRKSKGTHLLDRHLPKLDSVLKYGDEPVLMSLLLPDIPIVVSENRFAGAIFIEKHFSVDVILLDDGFQHRALKHNKDILIFKKDFKGYSEDYFPFGSLRDKTSRLRKADIILLESGIEKDVIERIKEYSNVLEFNFTYSFESRQKIEGEVTAFCAIAKAEQFFEMVESQSIRLSHKRKYRDHIHYSAEILSELAELKSDTYICTQKDRVKLPEEFVKSNNLHVLKMGVQLSDEKEFLNILVN